MWTPRWGRPGGDRLPDREGAPPCRGDGTRARDVGHDLSLGGIRGAPPSPVRVTAAEVRDRTERSGRPDDHARRGLREEELGVELLRGPERPVAVEQRDDPVADV